MVTFITLNLPEKKLTFFFCENLERKVYVES